VGSNVCTFILTFPSCCSPFLDREEPYSSFGRKKIEIVEQQRATEPVASAW